MGRTTSTQNQEYTNAAQGTGAYNLAQQDINQFNNNQTMLKGGQGVGNNPYQSTAYLSNVNKLQSEGLNTAANSAKSAIARNTRATGGLNASQNALAQRDAGLQTGRLADTLTAQRASQDYQKNLQWQQYLAGAPLSAAGPEVQLYGAANAGQTNANQALTSFWSNMAKYI